MAIDLLHIFSVFFSWINQNIKLHYFFYFNTFIFFLSATKAKVEDEDDMRMLASWAN